MISILAEFFVKWAEEKGWYTNPSLRVGRAVNLVGAILSSLWFLIPATLLAGLTAGVWLDWLLRQTPNIMLSIRERWSSMLHRQDLSAYNDLMAFAVDHLLPTCASQVEFQEALIRHFCSEAEKSRTWP